jgi:hypothetical protein
MKTIQKIKSYNAASEKVFACIDDLGVAGMHMTKSSMPMMGGKMDVEFLTAYKSGLHTRYRWTGKVLWWELDFTVEVTKWIKGKEKTWETIGPAKMIIYSWFQMNLKVEQGLHESIAYLSISYNKPKGIFNRILCVLVGPWYAKWCLDNMLNDTEKEIASEQPVHQHLTT